MSARRPPKGVDPVTGLPTRRAVFRCLCGKAAFLTRKQARVAYKRNFPGEYMQVYRCDRAPIQTWHFGHPRGHERTA
jgi:hypothetical protein